jgi:hypothetical protein
VTAATHLLLHIRFCRRHAFGWVAKVRLQTARISRRREFQRGDRRPSLCRPCPWLEARFRAATFSFLLFTAGSRSKSIFPRIAPFSIVYEKLISPERRDAATTDARGQLRLVWVKIHRRGCSVRTSGRPPIADEIVHRRDRLPAPRPSRGRRFIHLPTLQHHGQPHAAQFWLASASVLCQSRFEACACEEGLSGPAPTPGWRITMPPRPARDGSPTVFDPYRQSVTWPRDRPHLPARRVVMSKAHSCRHQQVIEKALCLHIGEMQT